MTESDSFPRFVSLRGEIVNRAAIQTQIQGKGERGQQGLQVSAYIQFKIKPLPPSLDCLRSAPFTLFLFSTSPLNIVGIAPLQKRPDPLRLLEKKREIPGGHNSRADPSQPRIHSSHGDAEGKCLCILPSQWMAVLVSHQAMTNPRLLTGDSHCNSTGL